MAEGRFILVYHEDLIANFTEIWDDDRALATWVRLFALADKQWPSPAEMPRGARASVVKKLVECGLVILLPNHRYGIRGLDAQRKRKSEQAKAAAAARYADSNAPSSADIAPAAMPHTGTGARPRSGSGPSSDSSGELGVQGEEGPDALNAYYSLTGRFPTGRVKDWLEELAKSYSDAAVERELAAQMIADRSLNTLLSRTENALAREAHESEKRRQDAARKAAEAERKRIEAMPEEQREANRGRLRQMMVEAGLMAPQG